MIVSSKVGTSFLSVISNFLSCLDSLLIFCTIQIRLLFVYSWLRKSHFIALLVSVDHDFTINVVTSSVDIPNLKQCLNSVFQSPMFEIFSSLGLIVSTIIMNFISFRMLVHFIFVSQLPYRWILVPRYKATDGSLLDDHLFYRCMFYWSIVVSYS